MKIRLKYFLLIIITPLNLFCQNNNDIKELIWNDFLIVNSAYLLKSNVQGLDFNKYYEESLNIKSIDTVTIEKFIFLKVKIDLQDSFNHRLDMKDFDFYIVKNTINNEIFRFNGFLISDFLIWERKLPGYFYDESDFFNFLLSTKFWSEKECKMYSTYFKKPKKCKNKVVFYSNFLKEIFENNHEIYESIMLFPY
ncbi:hypothetical protein [Flavobacterium sp. N2270]|jgi:hypothetical protein|uniref:hypothetical protein n=1 Tax=Flavobacterium sp. N2270 TaxID=2986831 RepID=UPI002224BD44|nr:hypothetical protein [Flavobacterium sp. N2270]